jgi:hypothetical protein
MVGSAGGIASLISYPVLLTVGIPAKPANVADNVDICGRSLATAPEVIAELRSLAATRQVFIKDTTDKRYPEALADRRFLAEDAQHKAYRA